MRFSKPHKFIIELIKPSHYDDDGYVIQWWRGYIPSNSLSTLYGLAADLKDRQILGDRTRIEISVRDEANTVIPMRRIIRRFRRNSNVGLVCLVGVQTNQFPRAVDIARQLRAVGIKVVIGGFHVSGSVAMLPALTPELNEASCLGITLFAGEAEQRLAELVLAAYENRLEPFYNFKDDLPQLGDQPLPFLPRRYVRRYAGALGCFDAGRGCPFSCSFCTIINVQGRKSRYRTADDIERLVRENQKEGIKSFFITDDNFARNRNWEAILDRLIELKEKEHLEIRIVMQVDTVCHKIPNFIDKAARAGCKKVFIGLESINPESLKAVSKGQNQITEYRAMLQSWRRAGVLTYAGYILGFPNDTPDSIRRDIRIIQRELPIDILEFFVLTPLPGSKDHQDLFRKGAWMESDLNKYDTEHVTTGHPNMTTEEWESIYREAWHLYYSPAHIQTLIRRAKASGISTSRILTMILHYYASFAFEGVHPLQGGILRRKIRPQRRPCFPRESRGAFFVRRTRDFFSTYVPGLLFLLRLRRWRRQIERELDSHEYSDSALKPTVNDCRDDLELFKTTEAARRAAETVWARAKGRSRLQRAQP